jgi:hypothetical protein
MSVQLNNMSTTKVGDCKARQLKYILHKYIVQFVGLGEVGINWQLAMWLSLLLLSLLPDLGRETRSMTAHNSNESISLYQLGGVGTIAIGEILTYYKKGANDFRNLGSWKSFILQSRQTPHSLRARLWCSAAKIPRIWLCRPAAHSIHSSRGSNLSWIWHGSCRYGEPWEIG